jgi:hypothetical protein
MTKSQADYKYTKKTKDFILGKEPSEPNPCPVCHCAMGALTICPNTHLHKTINLKSQGWENKLYELSGGADDYGDCKVDVEKAIEVVHTLLQDIEDEVSSQLLDSMDKYYGKGEIEAGKRIKIYNKAISNIQIAIKNQYQLEEEE